MSKILLFVGVLLMIGSVLSFYNKSYPGYTFILSDAIKDRTRYKQLELSFSDAQEWCEENVAGSTLATIRNQFDQQNINDFITSALREKQLLNSYRIRLNGKFHITNEWRWINGRPKASDITIHERNDDPNYFYRGRLVGKNCSIHSDKEKARGDFICEYPGNSEQCDLLLNGRCYQTRRYWLNWYEAINKCLDESGDLASFETLSDANINVSLKNLSLYSNEDYWIGLQKNEWRWEDTGSAIKYTKWNIQPTFKHNTRCLCLVQYQWNWIECDCSEQFPFICMLKDIPDSPTQGISTSTDMSDSPNQGTSISNETVKFIILAVSCAVIFVVIIVIAAALIAKKRRNSDAPRALSSSGYVTPKHAVTESSTDFPVYEEIIQNPKATNIPASDTTYASVVRKTVAKTEEEEHPVNSIVYAELDLTSKE